MPPRSTRSSARRGRGASITASKGGKQQQPISFGSASRVTKPGARSASSDGKKKLEDKVAALERADIKTEGVSDSETSLKASPSIKTEPKQEQASKTEDTTPLALRPQATETPPEPLSTEELAAAKLPDAAIKRYWAAREAERTTRRVHQEDLSLHEKVLRHFDMSSQYGNCIGIARTQRWKLAHELGLEPPMEVLAVLVREMEGAKTGKKGRTTGASTAVHDVEAARERVQRAYVDELMTSRFVV